MTPSLFERTYGAAADVAAKGTGVSRWTILAQWAVETGWGTSSLSQFDNNLAGIRWYGHAGTFQVGGLKGEQGTGFAGYHSIDAFIADYVATLNLPYYNGVRDAGSIEAEIRALGASPWDAGHYLSGGVVGGSVLAAWHLLPVAPVTYRFHIDAGATVDTWAKTPAGLLVDHQRRVWGPTGSGAACKAPTNIPVAGSPTHWRPIVVLATDGVFAGRYVDIAPTHGVHLEKYGG